MGQQGRFMIKEDGVLKRPTTVFEVVVDTETGVQYLRQSGGGITPLLDENGKLLLDKNFKRT